MFWDETETIDNQNESDINKLHNLSDNSKQIKHSLKIKGLDIRNYRQNIWTRFYRLITKVKFICKNFTPPPFFIYMVPEVNDRFYQGVKSPN